MASSLEELLADEGFRGRRSSGMAARASFRADAVMKVRHFSQDNSRTDSPLIRKTRTERTRSDVSRYILRGESPTSSDCSSSRRSRDHDHLVSRGKIDGRSRIESWKISGSRFQVQNDVQNNNIHHSEDAEESEITEIGEEEDEEVKDIYSDKAYNSDSGERSCQGNGVYDRYILRTRRNDVARKERQIGNSDKNVLKYAAFRDGNEKNIRLPDRSYNSSVRSSKKTEKFKGGDRERNCENVLQTVSWLALDEVAVKALISILNGYINRFIKEDELRVVLRNNCFTSLDAIKNGDGEDIKSKVISSLEQAIEIVEKAAEEAASTKDLKKAAMHLSAITSLNSNDLEYGLTSGVPNSTLSACGRLYLSVICYLQKKDKASSKYLLQVFCDSPFSARTLLLPEVWDRLFFPHLSHLTEWYNQEADRLMNTPSRIRKLKLLDKAYNEILDSGTYQLAVYYKEWLTDGIEAASSPSIHVPTISAKGSEQLDSQDRSLGLSRPSEPFSPQPMVSKKLYDAVFSHSSEPGGYEAEDIEEMDNFDNGSTIVDASACEFKQAIVYSSEIVKYQDQDSETDSFKDAQDNTCPFDNGLMSSQEDWKLVKLSPSPESDITNEITNYNEQQEPATDGHILNTFSHTKSNELILRDIAKSVFELQQTDRNSGDDIVSALSDQRKPVNLTASSEGLDQTYEYSDKGSFLASVPQDFICPLSGQLFEDPVTLETGQTFEREAIKNWFKKGNITCPVKGKTLECITVPFTNFILKRVIDSWKLEYRSQLLALASRIVMDSRKHETRRADEEAILTLEKLVTMFGKKERLANAKHLASLGGLEFLVTTIISGDLEEKTRIAAILSCCIEADAGCRNYIIKRIDKWCLLELLHSKQPDSRRNAVLLLTELLCLSRRKDVKLFLRGLQNEELLSTMHILVIYLQNSSREQRPWIAVLLLHLDLLVEYHKLSIYREEAVEAIAMALENSLTDENICENSCSALLALGGKFSASGKSLTESWILKQAGFNKIFEVNFPDEDSLCDDSSSLEDEEDTVDEWLKNLSITFLGNGMKSFLETVSKCLKSGNLDLMKACLTTIAWMSCEVSALSDHEFHLSAFSALVSGLKECLENGPQIELKVLASMSLLNFSKIPECRVMLMTVTEDIVGPLQSLVEVTWTAKQFSTMIISGKYD